MVRVLRLSVAIIALIAFGLATVAVAAEFYVVKDVAGKLAVSDKKPADAKSVVKGPFKTKEQAEKALKEAQAAAATPAKKPIRPADEGC
jgi:hypothetical protein